MSNKIQNNPTAFLKHFSNMTLEGVVRTMSATKFNFTNPLPTGIVRIETSQGKKLHTNTNTFISPRVCVCVNLFMKVRLRVCVCADVVQQLQHAKAPTATNHFSKLCHTPLCTRTLFTLLESHSSFPATVAHCCCCVIIV